MATLQDRVQYLESLISRGEGNGRPSSDSHTDATTNMASHERRATDPCVLTDSKIASSASFIPDKYASTHSLLQAYLAVVVFRLTSNEPMGLTS